VYEWWNDEVAELISEKRYLFKDLTNLKTFVDWKLVELNRKRYQAAKGFVKRAISRAQEAER